MIRRIKRQTKRRHSVLGGRKLRIRLATRMVAELMAAKIVEALAPHMEELVTSTTDAIRGRVFHTHPRATA